MDGCGRDGAGATGSSTARTVIWTPAKESCLAARAPFAAVPAAACCRGASRSRGWRAGSARRASSLLCAALPRPLPAAKGPVTPSRVGEIEHFLCIAAHRRPSLRRRLPRGVPFDCPSNPVAKGDTDDCPVIHATPTCMRLPSGQGKHTVSPSTCLEPLISPTEHLAPLTRCVVGVARLR